MVLGDFFIIFHRTASASSQWFRHIFIRVSGGIIVEMA